VVAVADQTQLVMVAQAVQEDLVLAVVVVGHRNSETPVLAAMVETDL
jgi:hypothetical protein